MSGPFRHLRFKGSTVIGCCLASRHTFRALLAALAAGAPFLMEVAKRTDADKKGGDGRETEVLKAQGVRFRGGIDVSCL